CPDWRLGEVMAAGPPAAAKFPEPVAVEISYRPAVRAVPFAGTREHLAHLVAHRADGTHANPIPGRQFLHINRRAGTERGDDLSAQRLGFRSAARVAHVRSSWVLDVMSQCNLCAGQRARVRP